MKTERSIWALTLFLFALLGVFAFGVSVIRRRRVALVWGWEVTGWRAVCMGVFILLVAPVILVFAIMLVTGLMQYRSIFTAS